MIDTWIDFALISVGATLSLAVTGCFIACEASMVTMRYRLNEEDHLAELQKRKRIGFLLRDSRSTAALIRFTSLTTSVISGLLIAFAVEFLLQPGGDGSMGRLLVGVFLGVSLTSLLGFLIPRGLGLAHPRTTLRLSSWVVSVVAVLLLPWFKLQRLLARRAMRLLGRDFQEDFNILDFEVRVRAITEEDEGAISPNLQAMLRNTLRLRELDVSDVLLPRHLVKIWDLDEPIEDNLAQARESGHSRFPLCHGDLDQCEGILHIKDIFRRSTAEADSNLDPLALRREIAAFNEETKLENALKEMLHQKSHMALVRDEFGGVIGVLTLESILEEIVGYIEDEFDAAEEASIRPLPDGQGYFVDGLTAVHDLEEFFEIEIDNQEVSTFGGLVTSEIGYIPEVGEVLQLEEPPLEVTVVAADETRLISANIRLLRKPVSTKD